MNKLFLILFCASVWTYAGCQNESSPKTTQTPKIEVPESMKGQPQNKKLKSPTHPSAGKRNYYKSTARRARDIDTIYPYDIPLKNKLAEDVNTGDVFKKNDKPTVLLFWLTTCVPCRYEMAAIQKKFDSWKEEADFNFYAISTDWPKNHDRFYSTVEKQGWQWETYLDKDREFLRVMPGRLNGLPQTFILDKNGKIAYHKRKYRTGDEDKLFEKIKEIASKG